MRTCRKNGLSNRPIWGSQNEASLNVGKEEAVKVSLK